MEMDTDVPEATTPPLPLPIQTLFFSGSCRRNSQPVGTSVAGSWTSTPPGVKCCLRWRQARSFIALTTVSTSTFFICSQWCSMCFFNLWIVNGSASLLSSWSSSPRSSKIWFTFSAYASASLKFWGPPDGQQSLGSSGIVMISASSPPSAIFMINITMYWIQPNERGNVLLASQRQGSEWSFWCEPLLLKVLACTFTFDLYWSYLPFLSSQPIRMQDSWLMFDFSSK